MQASRPTMLIKRRTSLVSFKVLIEKFKQKGEKTGWTYIHIPLDIANQLKADCRTSYRVKGFLDEVPVHGMAMVPMGEGDFILALKSDLRKKLGKKAGDLLSV